MNQQEKELGLRSEGSGMDTRNQLCLQMYVWHIIKKYIYIHTYTQINMYIYIYVHIHTDIYIYICIPIYTHTHTLFLSVCVYIWVPTIECACLVALGVAELQGCLGLSSLMFQYVTGRSFLRIMDILIYHKIYCTLL